MAQPAKAAPPAASHVADQGNPVFRMMGLPRFRAKLPSRNWLIFLSITGSFATALLYDRQQKKRAQERWRNVVSHLAREPLPVNQLPRKITIYLAAPPGDGLRSAREYFKDYVKPVLDAAALDWDVVEGRREGDVQAKLAEKIRKLRKQSGEVSEQREEEEDEVEKLRQKAGLHPSEGLGGDLIIGRHTWKEYLRGLHEGWLGPLDPPPEPPTASLETAPRSELMLEDTDPASNASAAAAATSPNPDSLASEPTPSSDVPPTKASPVAPYISPSHYPSSQLAPSIPAVLDPSQTLPFPHILGFLNTPIRTYRFLTRRYLADDVGKSVAEMILATSVRPWSSRSDFSSSVDPDSPTMVTGPGDGTGDPYSENVVQSGTRWEQEGLWLLEEKEWHKSARAPSPPGEEGKERVWLEDITIDGRIGERMTTFETSSDPGKWQVIENAQAASEASKRIGWFAGIRASLGWNHADERVKGWEHGLVGEPDD